MSETAAGSEAFAVAEPPAAREPSESVDDVDQEIIDRLREDARRPAATLAEELGLSATAVRRRLARLEQGGVIRRYTVVLDHSKMGPSLEAYVELDFSADADIKAFLKEIVKKSEVREGSMLAGHPDAIVRLRVRGMEDLQRVVMDLRKMGQSKGAPGSLGLGALTGIKTLVALGGRERYALELGEERSES